MYSPVGLINSCSPFGGYIRDYLCIGGYIKGLAKLFQNDREIDVGKANFAHYLQNLAPGALIDQNRVMQYLDYVQHHLGNRD